MTDADLKDLADWYRHNESHPIGLIALLRKVRLETARAAAEECRKLLPYKPEHMDLDTWVAALNEAVAAIRARFGVEP